MTHTWSDKTDSPQEITRKNNKLKTKQYYGYPCCQFTHPHIFWYLIVALILSAFIIVIIILLFTGRKTTTTTTTTTVITTTATTTTATTTTTTATTTTITTATSIISYVWNSTGTTVATINNPAALALDSSNALYVAEPNQNQVQKYIIGTSNISTVAGQANGAANSTAAFLDSPTDVAVDSNDNVYVLDKLNQRVQLWLSGASSGTTVAGTGVQGSALNQLKDPYNMARDPSTGTLYISDNGNFRVMRYLSGASSGTVVAGGNGYGSNSNQLMSPAGIYFESSSNSLVIANYLGHNVVRWVLGASNWTLIGGTTGTAGASSTMLNYPQGVTLDSLGNIYVADTGNDRIQLFFPGQSNGTTIAGVTGVGGSGPNQLNGPTAVIFDSQRNMYVADTGNNRIQMFSPS